MAESPRPNAFTPKDAHQIILKLKEPAVFLNMVWNWPVLEWNVDNLADCLSDTIIRFRLGRKGTKVPASAPLFETECPFVDATLPEFLSWTRDGGETHDGPFCDYPFSDFWGYADYKYISLLLEDMPTMFEDVKWSDFGFEERDGRESTLWIGTEGANTPCHMDSYGYNLVLQIQGRKRWHLYPPEDTSKLYPTRIPYEESSIFSPVNVLQPDLRKYPAFQRVKTHVVTLEPGQVLFVPRHWWHYVESVDPVTVSVNSWVEQDVDDVSRVDEAVTKAVVCALKSTPANDNLDVWLNPTEEKVSSHTENMRFVNLAVKACSRTFRGRPQSATKRHYNRTVKRSDAPSNIPFGPNLIRVQARQETQTGNPNDPEVGTSQEVVMQSPQDSGESSTSACETDPASAANTHQGQHESGSDKSQCGEGTSKVNEELAPLRITTNDLLDCLVHPEVIMHVTDLLLERRREQRVAASKRPFTANKPPPT